MAVTIKGMRRMPASRETVFAALNDVTCLSRCIPDCQSLVRSCENRFDLRVGVQLGPVFVGIDGLVEVTDRERDRRYVLFGEGSGGVLGGARGTTHIDLVDAETGCRLDYAVEAEAFGPLAALGPIALAGLARAMIDQFTRALADLVANLPPTARFDTALQAGRAVA